MSDFAWFCLMIIAVAVTGNAPAMIRAWRCKCDDSGKRADEVKP
jgi:hypothetical protein